MDTGFIKDFHVLSTGKGPVVFHTPSYRFFQVEETIAGTISALERGEGHAVSHEAIEHARTSLLKEIGDTPFQLKQNILGEGEGLTVFYLFVSQDCNLSCVYCYGDGGEYRKGRMMMTDEVADRFLDTFITGDSGYYLINLFGGEPLLDLPQVRRLVRKAREKAARMGFEISFNITTNGTVWNDEIRDFLVNDIDNVTVSFDGPKDIHDSQRPARGSFSPHDLTVRTLNELKQVKGEKYVIRTIITNKGHNRIKEIYNYNRALAPGGVGITTVDVEPSHHLYMNDDEYRVMVDEIVKNNTENLLSFASADEPQFYEYTFDLFELMFFKKYRPNPCNACKAVAAVAADGEVYPCHRFVGYTEFAMGNINDAKPLNENYERIRGEFRDASVDSMEECSQCWARYLCGGCCYVISYLREGDIAKPWQRHCYLKKTVYDSLLANFAELMSEPSKKEQLVANVKKILQSRERVVC